MRSRSSSRPESESTMPSVTKAKVSSTRPASARAEAPALLSAFEALKTYDHGSSRAALLPIDEAVAASLDEAAARRQLEQRLVNALKHGGPATAREYLCSKLTLIGSDAAVSALAALLGDRATATAARNALEAIPGNKATKALRDSLPKLVGLQQIGVINSLGARRDAESVRALTRLLPGPDAGIAAAAAAALGDIATTRAARALRDFLPRAPATLRLRMADAILHCAERLVEAEKQTEARKLYQLLAAPAQPKQVQQAAARGLRAAAVKSRMEGESPSRSRG